jgi:hypothetical protein
MAGAFASVSSKRPPAAAAATTYGNFARDFGERFVPGYEAPSTVDYLLNAPFDG